MDLISYVMYYRFLLITGTLMILKYLSIRINQSK